MKVLWFSGVEMPAVSGSKLKRGGWIEGYRAALEEFHPEIDLCVTFYSNKEYKKIRVSNSEYFPLVRKTIKDRIPNILKKWMHAPYEKKEVEKYLDLIQKIQPDLIHVHGTENPFGLVSEYTRVPLVVSMQANVTLYNAELFSGMNVGNFIGSFFSRDFIIGDGILHKKILWNKYQKIERRIMTICQNFIGRTLWDREIVKKSNPDSHYYHCDEIMAVEYYKQQWSSPVDDHFKIFSTTSNAFFKGAVELVKAVNIVNQSGWNISLGLAGVDKESEVGETISRIIKRADISDRIFLLGRLLPDEIISYMKSSHCFVLPSHIDNSPNSLCEAMLIGMPCIASNVGGIPSLIDDGITGILYNDKDPSELAKKIIWIKENPDKAIEMGKAARAVALNRHDRKLVADQLVEIYKKIVNNSTNLK